MSPACIEVSPFTDWMAFDMFAMDASALGPKIRRSEGTVAEIDEDWVPPEHQKQSQGKRRESWMKAMRKGKGTSLSRTVATLAPPPMCAKKSQGFVARHIFIVSAEFVEHKDQAPSMRITPNATEVPHTLAQGSLCVFVQPFVGSFAFSHALRLDL